MPKRIPTPPPSDDEPRYLTVVYPYAISGTCNMELPKDRIDFARWVACCIDKNAFFAFFHKPSSRGMVIIEISRDYPHLDKILGEHRWSEFLLNPTREESARVTQVFFCTYSTGRLVQKYGWKRIDVDEAWFDHPWSPRNRHIKYPYPTTHFCDLPIEDRTNHSICRPLPSAVKAPPVEVIPAPQPVVGSAEWIQTRDGAPSTAPVTTQSKPNPLGAWGQGALKVATTAESNPTASGSVKTGVGIPQGRQAGSRMPAVGGGSIAVKTSNVWQNTSKKAPVATNWDESPPVSRTSTPISRGISPSTAPTSPPGLTARKNAWGSGAPSPHPALSVPGNSLSVTQCGPDRGSDISVRWGSAGASTSSLASDSGPDLTTTTESDDPYKVHVQFCESMEEEFHGMGIKATKDEENELKELDSIAPGAWRGPTEAVMWEETAAAGWDDADALEAGDLWRKKQEITKDPKLCNAHGIICKKGICAEYAKQKRAEEEEQRKAAASTHKKKGSRTKDTGKKKEKNQDNATPVQNNSFRGPGAPVKTNWRGAPRALVAADTIEKRETTKVPSDDEWGNSDSEEGPNAADVSGTADDASDASWGVTESAIHPFAKAQPVTKAKKPVQSTTSDDWAEQVEAELSAGKQADAFTTVSSKRRRGSKRGPSSSTSWASSTAKTSTSGWGSVGDMPW